MAITVAYLLLGSVFAIPFVLIGVNKIDETARKATPGFRVIIIPGTILLWPILLRKWLHAAKTTSL